MKSVASTSSDSSSSSVAPSPLPSGEYEVFLSFRGPDVRNTFADHLYTFLSRSKIRTFRDNEELHKGEEISPGLLRAIGESKIYIPVLTEQYASSKWCLRELAKMVECWKQEIKGHLILPIFYFVEPRDVGHQEGTYKQAFERHSQNCNPKLVEEWKEALQVVSKMKGWHVMQSDGQGAIIDQVLSEVELHLRSIYTLMTDELVGIDTHVKEVMKLLNLDADNPKVVGIHGMGGIGKTTLSKAVYNKISIQFDRCCFLENVRDTLTRSDGAISLQNKLISSILRHDYLVKDASEGNKMIRERVCKHKVLVVLDDVDDRFEFDQILGKIGDFSLDSRFIITTRDKRVFDFFIGCQLYEIGEMSPHYSLQLFTKHAFGRDHPPEDYATLTAEIVKVAAGLPLALKVIGSLLFRRESKFWEETLIQLQHIPSTGDRVQERLKISYNDLSYNEKQIFLDIACCFIGRNKELPCHMWSSCSFSPESGINTLILRSLMKLDDKNQFWMHDHVRDLGRAIVREEDVRNPYKCSRIWSNEVALDLLRNKKGNDRVEVLMLDMYQKDGVFTDQNFKKLSGLRYLEVTLGRLTGDFSKILPNMRWLRMYGCRSIPTNFNMRKLVVLDLGHCDLKDSKKGWEGLREAHQLKVIDMESCTQLKRAPNLSQCRSLESINFNYCFGMKGALHIGNNLQNLKTLKFRETEITKLTGDIETLQCLEEIVASREVTDKFVELLPRLPTSLKRLSISIRWGGIPNLAELEDLEYLSLINCHQLLLRVDNNMWKLPNLKELKLFHCSWYPMLRMGTLPSSLTHLSVLLCGSFLSLPCLANLNNLAHLALTEFEEPEIRGLGELRALESVEINDAPNLTGLDGLENLLHLEELVVRNCGALERIPNLANLIKLRKLITINCRKLKLEEVTGLEGLVSLEELELSGSSSIRKLPSALSELRKLKSLNVGLCPNLTDATVAGKLESLGELQLWQCSSIRELPNLSGLKRNLNRLKISECTELTGVTGIGSLENLKVLCVSGLRMVREFEDLSGLENLVELDVSGCTELTRVAGIERMERLEKLYMGDCRSLTELVELSGLKKLVILNIGGCTELTAVRGVEKLSSLTHLRLSGCKSINGLGNLSGLKNLENLDIRGCTQITQVKGLEELEKLEWLESDLKFLPKYYWLRYGKRLVNRLLS